ncbi:hypothetical protein NBRC116602_14270 [Hyphomicrobiales bacterium 4NK60-0047b]|jgi:hypothetical protein
MGALSGCGASTNLASNFGLKTEQDSKTAQLPSKMKSVGFAPLVGVPANVSTKMLAALKAKTRAKNIPVTEEIATAGYLVRGYLVASPHSKGGKLSYIWDINDKKGVRIHRVLGNEILQGGKTSNGWALVNDQVINKVADASSGKLAGWFSSARNRVPAQKQSPQNGSPKRINQIAKLDQGTRDGTPGDPIITGAVSKAPRGLLTQVKPVVGAPGDGRISLTNALRRELSKNGIALSSRKVAGSYTVQGSVRLNKVSGKSEKVNIVWKVYDSTGNRVGTVSQNNVIPTGSLNGAWGPTAVAAASAAAKGIVKLLPAKK